MPLSVARNRIKRVCRESFRLAAVLFALALPACAQQNQKQVELGRYLVGEAGIYVCRVTDIKVSRGHTFLVADGGLHHHLSASGNFGQVLRKNYPPRREIDGLQVRIEGDSPQLRKIVAALGAVAV